MTNTWQEQTFDEPAVNGQTDTWGFAALDREIEQFGQDLTGLSMLVADRIERIRTLRRQLAAIKNEVISQ